MGNLRIRAAASAAAAAAEIGDRLDGAALALLLDVDGTLAPIAPTPMEARVPEASRTVLRRIVKLPGTFLALVSGRAVDDAWRVAGVPGAWVIGNHGFEVRSPDGNVTVHEAARRFEDAVAAAAASLRPLTETPGVILEDKRWTLSVHYRIASTRAKPEVVARASAIAARHGLRVTEGKEVVEIRPPAVVDKGTASRDFVIRVGALEGDASILYVGDDRTDEDAFRMLREIAPLAPTVRIAGEDDVSLDSSSAELLLDSPDELRRLLEWLVGRRERRA